ncbi:hypothetical protein DIPPA_21748 [Diplonema papillatum]|nr:hypothetical protein DIPPA_21748 [Diplonema papillatum]
MFRIPLGTKRGRKRGRTTTPNAKHVGIARGGAFTLRKQAAELEEKVGGKVLQRGRKVREGEHELRKQWRSVTHCVQWVYDEYTVQDLEGVTYTDTRRLSLHLYTR